MIKALVVVFVFLASESRALNADEYAAYIDELSLDEAFVEEYAKWSFKLFSQPDYLYGEVNEKFPCPIEKDNGNRTVPTSVHTLRPSDISCVAAMGDSLTAGLGAHALTPIGLLLENRGASWSIGGDHTYDKIRSLPNILREYNSNLQGYSTKISAIFLKGQNATHNQLNVAKSGDRSYHMPDQADILLSRLKNEKLCDWENDWKIITFFVGGNDLCSFCDDENKHTPEKFIGYIQETLDRLYNSKLPRTLVNLVLVLDVRHVQELNAGGPICRLLHKKTCPCAAFPTPEQNKTLNDYVIKYQEHAIDLINTRRYEGRSDFTVVVQPFFARTPLPRKGNNNEIDFSYFAPDCFHFSGKGHSVAALSLWNNMLEPVGKKRWSWHRGEELKCPTEQNPYIYTSQNSPETPKDVSQNPSY